MSSLTRTIQRTTGTITDEDGKQKQVSRRSHYAGRGAMLGTKNPKDPCLNRALKKRPKPWRAKGKVDPATQKRRVPRSALAQPLAPKPDAPSRRAAHAARMAERAGKRERSRLRSGFAGHPARLNRNTGQPHQHTREIGRRARAKRSGSKGTPNHPALETPDA